MAPNGEWTAFRLHVFLILTITAAVFSAVGPTAAEAVELSEVRRLARSPVNTILQDAPVPKIETDHYWQVVHRRDRPMIVFFYSNEDPESQRVATLVKYVALEYSTRIDFRCVQAALKEKPDTKLAKALENRFSLDATPGILFYDNHGEKMVLEKEGYVSPDFKEFRTPLMLLWNTYYAAVRKELDKLLAD
jgi:hypothetical protein